jgi:hypothetical protein
VIGACRLSDDDGGKNNGVKWKLVEFESANGITFLLLVLYRHFSKFLNKAFLKSNSKITHSNFIFTSPASSFLYASIA